MTDQLAAWFLIVATAFGAAALLFAAMRRWRRQRWLAAGLLLVWAATPFPVEEGHIAPAFVVFFFRQFLEEAANPRPPLALLLLATVLVLVIYGVAGLVAWASGYRRQRSGSGAPRGA